MLKKSGIIKITFFLLIIRIFELSIRPSDLIKYR
jgi:hypothetical protein